MTACQSTAPDVASSAIKIPSRFTLKSLPPFVAKPRFTGPQQMLNLAVGALLSDQFGRPVRASRAHALFDGPVMNIIRSRTSGVVSFLPGTPVGYIHWGVRRETVFVSI